MKFSYLKTVAATALAAALSSGAAIADQVFADDVIVDGSLCVGFDCVNGENFGFDTLRLKENNTRLHFDDTSTSGSFPNNDWTLIANDSSNGGGNYFSIEDRTAGRRVFTVEAGAPANSLYVDNRGYVGMGTSNPVLQLHVADGNTPSLRLEQDTSSGFTAQTWDIAGNEANFFVRDVTNGSTLPFRIEPGSPSNVLYLDSSGFVGIGTNTPAGPLHIKGPGSQRQMMLLEQTTANTNWVLANYNTGAGEGAGNFGINLVGGGNFFKIDTAGNVYLPKVPNCANGITTDASGMLSCLP